MTKTLENKSILLVISGGIAAYKSLDLIRHIRKAGGHVRCILTKGGAEFVTPLSISALCEEQVYTDLWSLKDESEMGHIRLAREADLILVAPCSANMMAKMAHGLADDLASTCLLAADTPILIAPAMNVRMWDNAATQDNLKTLTARGIQKIGPNQGDMACGEFGFGRMSEPEEIMQAITDFFFNKPLKGVHAIVTSGPTYEAIDPVRFIGNRSSGKQGHAIAEALIRAGADVTYITGPSALPDPAHAKTIRVETAKDMLSACENALPADIAICAAAVSDWAPKKMENHKLKKKIAESTLALDLSKTPDILHTISTHRSRPALVVGFAAETENLIPYAQEKLTRKKCDMILANDVSDEKAFGKNENHVHLVTYEQHEDWGACTKMDIAKRLVETLIESQNRQEGINHAAE